MAIYGAAGIVAKPLGNLTLEASGIWSHGISSTGETDSWRAQTKPCVQPDDAGKLCALCLFFDIQSIRGIRARSVLATHGLLLVHWTHLY